VLHPTLEKLKGAGGMCENVQEEKRKNAKNYYQCKTMIYWAPVLLQPKLLGEI
jgi:hypothetical protein